MTLKFEWSEKLIEQIYDGPYITEKYPGEDDPVWCTRCEIFHSKGAPWEIEYARIIHKLSDKIIKEIDDSIIEELKNGI